MVENIEFLTHYRHRMIIIDKKETVKNLIDHSSKKKKEKLLHKVRW
jgi:hypothetical protein